VASTSNLLFQGFFCFSYGSNFLQCVGLKESVKSKWDLNIAEVMRRDVIRMIRFEKLCPVGQTPDITFQ
jgi:hypothetical protein